MPTLYVENIPEELYEAVRARARERRRSIAAEVLALLEANVPTKRELQARREFLRKMEQMHGGKRASKRTYPSAEDMQREDRSR
jgi:plasmid stability protein